MVTNGMNFTSLPAELRLMVLEELIQDGCPLAPYTSVCREWQAVIEPTTFARLRLTKATLAGLADLTPERQELVQEIWLEVHEWADCGDQDCNCRNRCHCWAHFYCDDCQHYSSRGTDDFREPLAEFLRILGTWEPRQRLRVEVDVLS